MEQHHTDFALAHLTGKPKDIMYDPKEPSGRYRGIESLKGEGREITISQYYIFNNQVPTLPCDAVLSSYLRVQAEQDTKFYFILMQMLNEAARYVRFSNLQLEVLDNLSNLTHIQIIIDLYDHILLYY